ncbi:MAG: hypothetical protein GKR90_25085 [Pseudomonadales bacterium]|nr:hypothetical protein [Pseudomonadales bacterium]
MNVSDLLTNAPEVLDGLKGLGFDDDAVQNFGSEIGQQLGGEDGFDFTDLLSGLSGQDFASQINIPDLASKVGLAPESISKALELIAPVIEQFGGEKLGALGKLAGRFFK